MFETFFNNYIHDRQSVKESTLHKFENTQDGFVLWYARRVRWPLQKIAFKITVSTPRKLCCLEDIILYIYQTMSDNPPETETIARELAIYESAFVDKIIADLV